jgi:hypothetical protein
MDRICLIVGDLDIDLALQLIAYRMQAIPNKINLVRISLFADLSFNVKLVTFEECNSFEHI